MGSGIFIISICAYILSLVTALILIPAEKKLSPLFFKYAFLAHFLATLLFTAALITFKMRENANQAMPVISLFLLCSGVALSGLMLKTRINIFAKSYFAVLASSFILFVISPSTLFSIITKGALKVENYDRFNIANNYFLDRQSSLIAKGHSTEKYKVVQKIGYFNKTLSRDVEFTHRLDSIKTLSFSADTIVILRGYFTNLSKTDSEDVRIDLAAALKKNVIIKNISN